MSGDFIPAQIPVIYICFGENNDKIFEATAAEDCIPIWLMQQAIILILLLFLVLSKQE